MTSRSVLTATSLAFTVTALGTAASAAPASPLTVTTKVMVETRRAAPDGTTRIVLAKPTRVGPGDKVVVIVGYRNIGTQPLGDVALADPLPASIAFRGPRAGSPEPDVSIDGHRFAPLATLVAATPGGGTRAARIDDVTAVRWRLTAPLAPGGQGEFAFQGTIK